MIYIGNFLHTTHQQEAAESDRRHGEFNLIIEAKNENAALDMFKKRILEFRNISSLFEGQCQVYLARLLKLDEVHSSEALMFGYKSVAGDPVMPFIGCATPSDQTDGCEIFDWNNNIPEIEGRNGMLFLEFKN
ncbi:hypothetical protein DENIS_1098 [Desulfonema ishimotonii]|uniref:Uncharacterized protein n=1 Tax=Desulfonema ishimotonii TaxID=45657 RepID=A0A401FT73_9BACT|nr:hypothetical protein [Desulfonema ishimotonii]GBC60153.1 hypothetical protein DENIS_1098 [Desulfonema ishimotonii]